MKNRLLILAVISLLPGLALAQNAGFESDIDAELEQVTAPQTGPQNASGTPTGAAIAPSGSMNGSQPIYILNQATPTANSQVQQSQIQKQPQVEIQASPLTKSRAEQIRDARQQAEVETENKIVEKLEASRMEDERRRANVLFAEPFNQLSNQNNIQAQNVNVNQQQAVQQPVQAVQAVPVQVVKETKHEDDFEDDVDTRDLIRQEIKAAMDTEKSLPEPVVQQKYFGVFAGVGDYPDVRNVKGNYTLGAQFGTKFDDSYAVEGTFTYSEYQVDEPSVYGNGAYYPAYGYYVPRLVDVHQYSGSLALKYMLFNSMVRPVVGGLAQYSYRTFAWSQDQCGYSCGGYNGSGSTEASSHAFDIGAIAGADIEFSKTWTLGIDFRYMWNIASRVNTDNYSAFLTSPNFGAGTPIEKLQYYTVNVVTRVNF